jgi:5-aminopentanamidase
LPLSVGDTQGNLRLAIEALTAVAEEADVVVLPELANSGYVFTDVMEARSLAEPAWGPTTRAWAELAARHELVVVGGLCELDDGGRLRNSAVMLDGSGLLSVYRKAHLWDAELDVFVPGSEPPPVIKTRFGLLSMMVCYDVEFPEWVRVAALGGAELLCVPTNWPVCGPLPGPYPVEVLRVLANANTNLMYVAAAARVGTERGVEWVPGSGIASPAGRWLTSLQDGPANLMARIDLAQTRDKATSARNHPLTDRRPELYAALGGGASVTESGRR